MNEELRHLLLKAVLSLENIPEKQKDWQPGSYEQVHNLVDPTLFPLVFGHTRILPNGFIDMQDGIERSGDGEIVEAPSEAEVVDPSREYLRLTPPPEPFNSWSRKFQCLPSIFEISPDRDEVK